jgi:predicted alpha/beta-fold hydrolase
MKLCNQHLKHYVPTFYLFPHGALQQLWHIYFAKDREIQITYERDIIKMVDGGQISVDWAYPETTSDEN